jgi:serine/threonine protein kinase
MIGQTISHYRIVEKLGAGGMGVVYKAADTRLNRFFALKISARGSGPRPAGISSLPARGAVLLCTEPPQYLHDSRHRRENGRAFHRHGVPGDVTLKHRMVGRPLDIETLLSLGVEIADGFDSKFAGAQGRFHAS